MKKQFFFLAITVVLIMGCKSMPPDVENDYFIDTSASPQRNETGRTSNSAMIPSSMIEREWKLIEVYIDGKNTGFNRNTLPTEPRNFFTLNFDAQNVSGVGLPNQYSAPYTKGNNQSLAIMLIRATMMASFFQPENITEHDFFTYIQNASSWKLDNDNLELLSKTQDGGEVRLVFSL